MNFVKNVIFRMRFFALNYKTAFENDFVNLESFKTKISSLLQCVERASGHSGNDHPLVAEPLKTTGDRATRSHAEPRERPDCEARRESWKGDR